VLAYFVHGGQTVTAKEISLFWIENFEFLLMLEHKTGSIQDQIGPDQVCALRLGQLQVNIWNVRIPYLQCQGQRICPLAQPSETPSPFWTSVGWLDNDNLPA
jgi:hypothetical protein